VKIEIRRQTGMAVMKTKPLWDKIKYEIFIFAVLAAQALFSLARNGGIPTNFLTFYLLDYKIGFISRAFIGSFIGLLTQRVTEKWLTGFILLTFLLVYALLALLLGAMLRRVPSEQKSAAVFLVAVFLFANFSVKVFVHNIGLLDIYLYLFVLLAAICLKNKYARWLLPLICLAGVATHYGFVMIFFPLVFVMLCCELSRATHKASGVALTAASVAATLAGSVYFVIFSNSFIRLDRETVLTYLQSKSGFPVWRFFVEGILFYNDTNTGIQVSGFSGFLEILRETAAESFRPAGFAGSLILLTPLFLFFFFIWKNAIKYSTGGFEKTVFLFCLALPLPLLPWFVFSTDTPRFLAEIIVVQFSALFYMLFDGNKAVTASLKKTEDYLKKYPLVLLLLLVFSLSAFYFK
jgi:hypothetical protein